MEIMIFSCNNIMPMFHGGTSTFTPEHEKKRLATNTIPFPAVRCFIPAMPGLFQKLPYQATTFLCLFLKGTLNSKDIYPTDGSRRIAIQKVLFFIIKMCTYKVEGIS